MYRQDCTHIFTAKPDVVFRTTFAILRYNVAILLCKLLGASCNRFQKLLPKRYNVLTIHLHIFITKHVNDYKVHVACPIVRQYVPLFVNMSHCSSICHIVRQYVPVSPIVFAFSFLITLRGTCGYMFLISFPSFMFVLCYVLYFSK